VRALRNSCPISCG